MSELPKELQDAWDEANRRDGVEIPVGRSVVCDFCCKDYTDSPESGGCIFTNWAICPDCMPEFLEGVKRTKEEKYIQAYCPAGMPFGEFVRWFCGERTIKITRFGGSEPPGND